MVCIFSRTMGDTIGHGLCTDLPQEKKKTLHQSCRLIWNGRSLEKDLEKTAQELAGFGKDRATAAEKDFKTQTAYAFSPSWPDCEPTLE
jgi:hypothetical protein